MHGDSLNRHAYAGLPLLAIALLTLSASPALGQVSANAAPGFYYHEKANEAYEAGRYTIARERHEMAARWADKLSQYNLGVMHYHGQGVPADRARAWAWFKLSAERRYPAFLQMLEQVGAELDAAERVRAQAIFEELEAEFGDAVAVPRADRRMQREMANVTGSRAGFVGTITVIDGRGSHIGADYFKRDNWDFASILDREAQQFDALERTRVELREMRVKEPQDTTGRND
jgi:hypothetical protein